MTFHDAASAIPLLDVFIPGKLVNPLNNSWGSWYKHARISRAWREKTALHLLLLRNRRAWLPAMHPLAEPKRITFTAYVGAPWDDDAIPAACKPVRDALVGIVIQGDDPSCGHEFVYRQETRPQQRGVGISVTPR
jgi:hypothetical protein